VAAGFERWDESKSGRKPESSSSAAGGSSETRGAVIADVFGDDSEDDSLFDGDDDFDVPSFLK
jgi:hypothetical protein